MSNRLPTLRQAGGIASPAIHPRFAPVRNHGNLVNPGSDFLAAIMGTSGPLVGKVNEMTAMGVSTVYACVSYIASIVSTLPLDLYVKKAGSRKTVESHPARRVLVKRPNPIMTSSDVRYAMAYNQALHGNGYAQLVFDRAGRIAEMWPLRARNVSMTMKGRFPEYRVTGDKGAETLGFDKILHVRGMSCDGLMGSGPVGMVANLIGLAQALEENASQFFANGSRPGMIYALPPGPKLSEQQINAFREQLRQAYSGVENFFKMLIVEGGGKVEMMRSANDSSQFDEISKRVHQQICQVFGVPPHKVGILDHATFSNIEQQQIQAVQDLFLPWCVRWEEAFGGALLDGREIDNHYFKHSLDGLRRGDTTARFAGYSTGLQNGIYSINETRAFEDLDPIDGGDVHVRQLNMTDILAEALNKQAAA